MLKQALTGALLAASFHLAGCATPGELHQRGIATTLQSDKTPRAWAMCVVDSLGGDNDLRNDGEDHYWVVRKAAIWQEPIVRWDFYKTPVGSRAEMRRIASLNPGTEKVRACG